MGDFIKIKDALVSFGDFELGRINMSIDKGYIVGIRGDNGAGKSTFLKLLMGCYGNMEGNVCIDGLDVIKDRHKLMSKVAYVAEDRSFFENYDAYYNECRYKAFYENWSADIYRNYLNMFNIRAGKKLSSFSKGERIKFQFAFAMAQNPALIIMDEPTGGLDPVFRTEFMKHIMSVVCEKEISVLIATHIEEDIEKIADYIIEINDGMAYIKENII